jgi:acyl-CoA thioester hydrolase
MYITETQIRVRYGETDRMGYVYYGVYASYYEVARVEALRNLGMSYREMEDNGILLPVLHFEIKYHKPAYYDDLIIIKTTVGEMPKARIRFTYESFNAAGELINTGETTLVFINKVSGKPCAAPHHFQDKLKQFFPA